LFGSGRPVFIVPHIHKGPAKLDKAILLGWRPTVGASRADAPALLSLARAVEVVSFKSDKRVAQQICV
jgi:hypothetical protein